MMGSTQITLGEIEMKEGWVKGERMTDNKGGEEREVGPNGPQGKSKGGERERGREKKGRHLNPPVK